MAKNGTYQFFLLRKTNISNIKEWGRISTFDIRYQKFSMLRRAPDKTPDKSTKHANSYL